MKKNSILKMKIVSNIILGVMVLSVGSLCLSPTDGVPVDGEGVQPYYSAGQEGKGVSLMFNVYDGTEEVYQILSVLEKYAAKVTFFIGGCWADDNVQCLQNIYAKGHEIGNHGYFHKEHTKITVEQNQREITACNRLIELSVGIKPTFFAPPSGSYNQNTLAACKTLSMKMILWNKDTIDWRDKNAALIYERATKNIRCGDFVLMHPTKETADALEDILKYYQKHSLKTVTVSENLTNRQ